MANEPLYTEAQYIALKEAISSGERRVKYQDKEVEYRSLSEMKEVLQDMANELGYNGCAITRTQGVYCKGA